ncbi:IDEAL domain-containing protein [Oceanobacillus bengalensis]|uniref:IDEAL domain-containing protein n=1 Tax=Oceanobacillus bengalensis TaxID=1435466 RepID=A0A494Z842_9BACI|nr:IDEAL domain-containing protein [Oceanobacillus bengalensis]RKQ18781.1 IDEAL domain-containing protein [Oceanobacillus bengalensis]
MKKEKMIYLFYRYDGNTLYAKKEIPYEFRLSAQLILDELCFDWNKKQLENKINETLITGDKDEFMRLCEEYRHFLWE